MSPSATTPRAQRTFTRLVPPDSEQAALLVRAMREAGVERLSLADDDRPAGRRRRPRRAAGRRSRDRGGRARRLDPGRPVPEGLAAGLRRTRPDAFLYAGANVPFAARVLRTAHRALPRGTALRRRRARPRAGPRRSPRGRRPAAGPHRAPRRDVERRRRVRTPLHRRLRGAAGPAGGPGLRRDAPRAAGGRPVGLRASSRRALVREALRTPAARRSRFRAHRPRGTRLVTLRPQM